MPPRSPSPEHGSPNSPGASKRLFGTDGIRGKAGEFPLDVESACAAGIALGEMILARKEVSRVVVGMDTRESSPWLAAAVAGGLVQAGIEPHFAGVITTPGLALLARQKGFAAGVMISASHNPYQDNGIKVFGPDGYKLPDELEQAVEKRIFELLGSGLHPVPVPLWPEPELVGYYEDYLCATFPYALRGMKLVLDCAHGSAYELAPRLFQRLGARVIAINCAPDGRNINHCCGALHVEGLRQRVLAEGADLGIAFDGDADRAIFVASNGQVLDGDAVLFMSATWLDERGKLAAPGHQPVVVATVMSNLGLERALGERGIRLVRTPVGDKYVLEEMLRRGAVLGGEQSGHIIFLEFATTGDGLLTTLRVLEILISSGARLDDYAARLPLYPQCLLNVQVGQRRPLEEIEQVRRAIEGARQTLAEQGRVLVRFSGTEPVVRVMVEGPDEAQVRACAERIAAAIKAELGVQ